MEEVNAFIKYKVFILDQDFLIFKYVWKHVTHTQEESDLATKISAVSIMKISSNW